MPGGLADSGLTWADVLSTWYELDVPRGWQPKITPGGIVMTPPPIGAHNLVAETVHKSLIAAINDHLAVFQTLGVAIPAVGAIFVPDLCVVDRSRVPHGLEPVASEHVVLAVEIASRSNVELDRKRERWAYAHGGIAQYLLIDPFDEDGPTVSLFSNPADGIYRNTVRAAFGQPLTLCAPVACSLDSSRFFE